jgi:hypothetical protein
MKIVSVQDLVKLIKKKNQGVYHFTDLENLNSIRRAGSLLSKDAIRKNLLIVEKPGGDHQSRISDGLRGISNDVSLSLTDNHPMKHICQISGRQPNPRILKFHPEILNFANVRMALGMANDNKVKILPIVDVIASMDLEVLYGPFMNDKVLWKKRIDLARRYEVLIPYGVSMKYLMK